jgi:hypothetical protein
MVSLEAADATVWAAAGVRQTLTADNAVSARATTLDDVLMTVCSFHVLDTAGSSKPDTTLGV